MFGEQVILKNKKNSRIRNIILLITILLFLFFIVLFINSFRKYNDIQHRILEINKSSNIENQSFVKTLQDLSEAEYFFRLYTIDFNAEHFSSYEKKLRDISLSIDSTINHSASDNSNDFQYIPDIKKRETLSKEFLAFKLKLKNTIDSVISISFLPVSIPKEVISNNKVQLKTDTSTTTRVTPKYVVVEKKPLLKRLFGKQKDTIKFDEIDHYSTQKNTLTQNYKENLSLVNKNAQKQISNLKLYYEEARKKERNLLAANFKLLNDINQIIQDIQSLNSKAKNEISLEEVNSLLSKSISFRWQVIFCLFFMFCLVCIIVYYQFFTTYYEKKLVTERIYASKLAKEKTDILAEITHEIRTPINSLIGIIDLLRKKDHLYDQNDITLLDSAYSNINNTSKTINDILNLSKIEQNDDSTFANFNMNELTEEVIEMHLNQAKLKHIVIKNNPLPSTQEIIHSDEFKIRQMMTNLISNAIKYSEKGTVTVTNKIDSQNNLVIEVKDEGIGIPEILKENIFKKYYTVNKALKLDGGVGLGLFITQKLINSLKGKISFTSKKNEGTTFKIEIPVPKIEVKSHKPTIHSIEDFPKDISWLIVDDNALNLLYMKQFFSKSPHILSASNGLQAFNLIQNNKIDVVITDINMPIMTGDQLLVNIRENREYNHIIVIATSSDNEQVRELEKLHGIQFDGILTKPFNEKKLTETIDSTLKRFKSPRTRLFFKTNNS